MYGVLIPLYIFFLVRWASNRKCCTMWAWHIWVSIMSRARYLSLFSSPTPFPLHSCSSLMFPFSKNRFQKHLGKIDFLLWGGFKGATAIVSVYKRNFRTMHFISQDMKGDLQTAYQDYIMSRKVLLFLTASLTYFSSAISRQRQHRLFQIRVFIYP